MEPTRTKAPGRQAAITGLAIVGFVALIGAGIGLAVYAARYVPNIVSGIGEAAVYVGSVFTPAPSSALSVVPTASTTLPFAEPSSTPVSAPPALAAPAKPVTPTAGQETSGTYRISGGAAALSGLPDLAVSIDAVGYLATSSADSFVEAATVPHGSRPAVRFTVKNIGTNVAGAWRFFATIPAANSYVYQSNPQQGLNPGDSIEFTLGFDQADAGTGQKVSISINPDHAVAESDMSNDSASATLTILGS